MYIRKKKYPSGYIGVIVVEKSKGKMKERCRIGIASDESELLALIESGKEWIAEKSNRRSPTLDLFGEEREACEREKAEVERVLSQS